MEEAANSVRRRKARAIPRRRHALIRYSREYASTPPLLASTSPPLKPLMKYAVPAVLALLMLRHQPKPSALFRENPAPLWSFVAATAVYWLVVEAMTRCPKRYYLTLRRAAFAVGVQSGLSLLSLFLPYPLSLLPLLISGPFAMLFACIPIILTLLITVINKIRAMAVWTGGVDEFTNRPHISPV